jgi:hypothetical protein
MMSHRFLSMPSKGGHSGADATSSRGRDALTRPRATRRKAPAVAHLPWRTMTCVIA